MNRSHLKSNLIFLTAIATLSLLAASHTIAQDTTCALSGRVVDTEGNPVASLSIVIQPFAIVDGRRESAFLLKEFMPEAFVPLIKSQTDEAGRFSVTGIKPGPIQFVAQPAHLPEDGLLPPDVYHLAPDADVLSIEIGAIIFYPPYEKHPPFGGITFGIEPGTHLKHVEVTVNPRMRIRGQILFADGTPLANAKIHINVRRRDFDGTGTGSSSGGSQTDSAGYFVKYVDEPGFYTVAVESQRLSAISEQLTLEAGQRYDDLVLRFDSQPVPIKPTPDRDELDSAGQWVLNPANNHSYKRIHCENWDDAQTKAVAEGVHLVSINNAEEQEWLVRVFGTTPYWIGLTDVAKEGEWGWLSGEPATYTHWATHKLMDADRGDEDYAFMGLSPDGRWHKVGPQSPEWQMPRMAILEKEDLPAESSVEEK
ncbi:hypothetical protein F4X33_00465 [Candidatus Poribacteria bacterium]|nr:hypothetical protein [Candidatus Poribacteria bacterium]